MVTSGKINDFVFEQRIFLLDFSMLCFLVLFFLVSSTGSAVAFTRNRNARDRKAARCGPVMRRSRISSWYS
jgi:hypothetical protein